MAWMFSFCLFRLNMSNHHWSRIKPSSFTYLVNCWSGKWNVTAFHYHPQTSWLYARHWMPTSNYVHKLSCVWSYSIKWSNAYWNKQCFPRFFSLVPLICPSPLLFWHHSTLNSLQHWGLIWKASLKFVINKTNHTWVEWHIPKSGAHLTRNKTEHESIILMRQKLWRKTFNFRNISPFLVELYSFCLETKSNYHALMWKYLDGYQRFQHK